MLLKLRHVADLSSRALSLLLQDSSFAISAGRKSRRIYLAFRDPFDVARLGDGDVAVSEDLLRSLCPRLRVDAGLQRVHGEKRAILSSRGIALARDDGTRVCARVSLCDTSRTSRSSAPVSYTHLTLPTKA